MSTTERDSGGRFARLKLDASSGKLDKPSKPDLTPERQPRAIDKTTAGGRKDIARIVENPSDEQFDAVVGRLQAEWKQTYPNRDEAAFNYFDRVLNFQGEAEYLSGRIKANRAAVRLEPPDSAERHLLDQERVEFRQRRRDLLTDLDGEVQFARESGLKVEPQQDTRGTTLGERISKVAAEAGWYGAAVASKVREVGVERRAQRFVGRQVERATETGGRLRERAGNAIGERVQDGRSWMKRAGDRFGTILDEVPGRARGAAAVWAERHGVGEKVGRVVAALNRVGGWVDGAKDAVGARVSSEWQRLAGPSREIARAASARLENSKDKYKQSEAGIMRAIGLRLEETGEFCQPFVDRIQDEGRYWRNRAVGIADGVDQGVRGTARGVAGGVENLAGRASREVQLRWEAFGETAAGQLLREGLEHARVWTNDGRSRLNGFMERVGGAAGAAEGRFKKLYESATARLTRKSEADSRTPSERKSVAEYLREKSDEVGRALGALREYVSARMVGKAKEAGMDDKEANAFMKFAGAAGARSAEAAQFALGGTVVSGERLVRFVASHKKGTAIALGVAAAVAMMVHPDAGQWIQQAAQGLSEVGTAIGNAGANAAATPDIAVAVGDLAENIGKNIPDIGTGVAEAAQAVSEVARTATQEIAAGLPVGQENGIWNQVQDAIKDIQDPAQQAIRRAEIFKEYALMHQDNIRTTNEAIVNNPGGYRPGEIAFAQAALKGLGLATNPNLDLTNPANQQAMADVNRYLNPNFVKP